MDTVTRYVVRRNTASMMKIWFDLHETRTVHLGSLAPGQHSSEETSQQRRVVGDSISDLTGPVIEPQTSRTDNHVLSSTDRQFMGNLTLTGVDGTTSPIRHWHKNGSLNYDNHDYWTVTQAL